MSYLSALYLVLAIVFFFVGFAWIMASALSDPDRADLMWSWLYDHKWIVIPITVVIEINLAAYVIYWLTNT